MIRYTTPVLIIRVHADITDTQIYVTFKQKELKIIKQIAPENVTLEDGWTILRVEFTQKETAKFRDRVPVGVDINWVYADGARNATDIKYVTTIDNLLSKEVHYVE